MIDSVYGTYTVTVWLKIWNIQCQMVKWWHMYAKVNSWDGHILCILQLQFI